MRPTAVEILDKSNPLNRKEIEKISEKWKKRSAKADTKWTEMGKVITSNLVTGLC